MILVLTDFYDHCGPHEKTVSKLSEREDDGFQQRPVPFLKQMLSSIGSTDVKKVNVLESFFTPDEARSIVEKEKAEKCIIFGPNEC